MKIRQIAPWDNRCLSPPKLAAFYRLVGGDFDSLFLDTPHASLSFIYKSVGCYHTLQPMPDPFASPTIPALTPQGFIRWQTVQLLLLPEQHVPFLQEAVKRLEIINPHDGRPFPRHLPSDALPRKADMEMTRWHETVAQKLRSEAEGEKHPRIPAPLSEISSLTDSSASVETESRADADDHFNHQSRSHHHHHVHIPHKSPIPRRPHNWKSGHGGESHGHRRRSFPSHDRTGDGATPTAQSHPSTPRTALPRSPSILSIESSEATDELAADREPSLPLEREHRDHHDRHRPPQMTQDGRRHSSHGVYNARDHSPQSQPTKAAALSPPFFAAQSQSASSMPPSQAEPSVSQNAPSNPGIHVPRSQYDYVPSGAPTGSGVRWRDMSRAYEGRGGAAIAPGEPANVRFADDDPNFSVNRPRQRSMEPVVRTHGRSRVASGMAYRR